MRTYDIQMIHLDVDGSTIEKDFKPVTVPRTNDEKKDKAVAQEVAETIADSMMPHFDSNSYLIVFIV